MKPLAKVTVRAMMKSKISSAGFDKLSDVTKCWKVSFAIFSHKLFYNEYNKCIVLYLEKVRMLENPSIAAEPPQVVIGDGITANKAVVDDIIMDWSRNPSKFLRQLMLRTKIFSLEEMANSSVKGCRSRDGRRPALDVHKFSAVKSTVYLAVSITFLSYYVKLIPVDYSGCVLLFRFHHTDLWHSRKYCRDADV